MSRRAKISRIEELIASKLKAQQREKETMGESTAHSRAASCYRGGGNRARR